MCKRCHVFAELYQLDRQRMHRPFLHKKHREFIRDIAERRHVMLAGDHLGRGVAWRAARGFQERALRVPARKKSTRDPYFVTVKLGNISRTFQCLFFFYLQTFFNYLEFHRDSDKKFCENIGGR